MDFHPTKFNFVFFGTDYFSVVVLDELRTAGFNPSLIVTAPDKRAGRGLRLASPPVAHWARENNIKFLQPKKLDSDFINKLTDTSYQLFVIASYGKIIPQTVLDVPQHGALNVHPSLLPRYRGASPLQEQIIDGAHPTGVTIMLMDEKMDHGPIVAQQEAPDIDLRDTATLPTTRELGSALARLGGQMLANTLPGWIAGAITSYEQDHPAATFTRMVKKEDGLIDPTGDAEKKFRKIKAYAAWPGAYFFTKRGDKDMRVKITAAEFKDGTLNITRVIPEGKQEMNYADFLCG